MKRGWFLRIARISFLAVAALISGTIAYIRVEQFRFRHSAEQVLVDMRALQLRKASGEEVRRVVQKWHFESDDKCTAESCSYTLVRHSLSVRLLNYLKGRFWPTAAARILAFAGGRPAAIFAHVEARQKTAWFKGMSIWIWIPPWKGGEKILRTTVNTQGEMESEIDYERPAIELERRLHHSDYLVGERVGTLNVDTGPYIEVHTMWAEFSPETDSTNGARLMQFDLSCLTRFRACRENDLMPAAWRDYEDDQRKPPLNLACTPELSRRVAVLAEVIIVARADSIALSPNAEGGSPYRLAGFRMVRPIKGPDYLRRGLRGFIEVDNAEMLATSDAVASDIGEKLRTGQEYILLLQSHPYGGSEALALYPCGVLTVTAHNLDLARAAAASAGLSMGWIRDLSIQ